MDRGAWWATVHGVTKVRHDWACTWRAQAFLGRHLAYCSLRAFSAFIIAPVNPSYVSISVYMFVCVCVYIYMYIGEGNGIPLQYSCLENPMDRGAWWAVVHGVAQSWTRLKRLHFHFSLPCIGEGNGRPLQCSCLENPRDGGAWWAAVYGVAQSRTRLKWLSSIYMYISCWFCFSGEHCLICSAL